MAEQRVEIEIRRSSSMGELANERWEGELIAEEEFFCFGPAK